MQLGDAYATIYLEMSPPAFLPASRIALPGGTGSYDQDDVALE